MSREQKALVILDFAGTLSIHTTLFGRSPRIDRALHRSGLSKLGFGKPEQFWQELVFPTWEEGALTQKGYDTVLAEQIGRQLRAKGDFDGSLYCKKSYKRGGCRLKQVPSTRPLRIERGLDSFRPVRLPPSRRQRIVAATQRFVNLYFAASRIDPHWRPLFLDKSFHNRYTYLIATDHYAECTPHLLRTLHRWGISARPILSEVSGFEGGRSNEEPSTSLKTDREIGQKTPQEVVWIANSADLGAFKAEERFWKQVNRYFPLLSFQKVWVIDDFGYNESKDDPYANPEKVRKRIEALQIILSSLRGNSSEGINLLPFFLRSSYTTRTVVQIFEEYSCRIQEVLNRLTSASES